MKQKNYTWRHLYNSSSAKIAKFKCMVRCGVPQADWVDGNKMCQPIVAIAPPMGGCYE